MRDEIPHSIPRATRFSNLDHVTNAGSGNFIEDNDKSSISCKGGGESKKEINDKNNYFFFIFCKTMNVDIPKRTGDER